jgi:hypothetical protein
VWGLNSKKKWLKVMSPYAPQVSNAIVCLAPWCSCLRLLTAIPGSQETLQKLYSELNIQSNVIVAATYSNGRDTLLKEALLFQALRKVIAEQPALSIVMHEEPSKENQTDRRSWEGRLKSINLPDCVSYLNDYDVSSNGLQNLLETNHNEWFDVQDRKKPLWRLVVVNKTHVLFIYNHFIADGSSGLNFHQSLLSALNRVSKDDDSAIPAALGSPVIQISSAPPLPPRGLDLLREQFSYYMVLVSVMHMIYLYLLRFMIPKQSWIFPEVDFDQRIPLNCKLPLKCKRPVTKVQRLYLHPLTLASCLEICRRNNVSFTALLYTLISITLAVDIYPEAKISNSNTLVNLRRFVNKSKRDIADKYMTNITSGFLHRPWLSAYRSAETPLRSLALFSDQSPCSTMSNGTLKANHQTSTINHAVVWDLARKYKAALDAGLRMPRPRTSPLVQNVLSISKLMPADEEAFASAIFATMRTLLPNIFSLSNLGAFTPAPASDSDTGSWTITNMEFSVSSYRIGFGAALYFAIISVKGGACVMNVDYQEGVIEDDLVERVIAGVERRLLRILQ